MEDKQTERLGVVEEPPTRISPSASGNGSGGRVPNAPLTSPETSMGESANNQDALRASVKPASIGLDNPPLRETSANKPGPSKGLGYLLMVGHLCTDINQGALAATLPFLVVYSGFSYTEVALLIFAANIASAVIQPLFGYLGDKKSRPWFMALGVFLAGLGMAGVGLLHDYSMIICSAMVSGIGVAMFHPDGGRLANLVAGEQKGQGMSVFAVGGNIGFCLGPIMAATFLSMFGMAGTGFFLIHSTLAAVLLLAFNKRFLAYGLRDEKSVAEAGGHDHWGMFSLTLGVLSFRSIIFNTLITFVPLFLVGVLGQSESFSSLVISLYSVFGAFATFMSGRTAALVGTRRLLLFSMVLLVCVLVGFGLCHSLPLALVLICLAAPGVNLPYAATVAMGQGYVPQHLGTASGLTYGVAVSVGGIVSPLMGTVGDTMGLSAVFFCVAAMAAAGVLLALILLIKGGSTLRAK